MNLSRKGYWIALVPCGEDISNRLVGWHAVSRFSANCARLKRRMAFHSTESEGFTLPTFWNSQNSIFPIVLVLHRKCFSDDARLLGIEIQ